MPSKVNCSDYTSKHINDIDDRVNKDQSGSA